MFGIRHYRYKAATRVVAGRWLRAALLASTAHVAAGSPAAANDATWLASLGSGDFNSGANWDTASVPTGNASFGASSTTSLSFSSNTTIGGWTFNPGAAAYTFSNSNPHTLNFTGAGIVVNGGSAAITNNIQGVVQFFNSSTAGGATISNSGNLNFLNTSSAGSAAITNSSSVTFSNASTAGNAAIVNSSIVTFSNTSTAGNATITNKLGVLTFNDSSTAGNASLINGRTLYFNNSSSAGNATITNNGSRLTFWDASTAGSATITNNTTLNFQNASTAGNAAITNNAGGTVDFSGSTGPAGDHRLSAGSIAGAGSYLLGANQLTVGGNNGSTKVGGVISGTGGSLVKVGTGTLTLSGANTYTGATVVSGGTLEVDGALTGTSSVTVNAGGRLTGTGIIDPLAVTIGAGGTLLAGNATAGLTTHIEGNLAFESGALYVVALNPSAASSTSVTGTATLGGATVNALWTSGAYVARQYTILTSKSVSGTFGATVNTNLPSGFKTALSYDAGDVYLNLSLSFVGPPGTGLNNNQQNVANAVTGLFNRNGSIPLVFGGLTPSGLTRISGEGATAAQQAAFNAMGLFMGVMTDPFTAGRGEGIGGGNDATGYADEIRAGAKHDPNDAFGAIIAKAGPTAPSFEPRWSVWTAGYGGSQKTDGSAAVGSNNTTSSVYGTAVRADYRFSPETVAGFALAGGGTNFSVVNGGSGRSDLFQAGGFITHTMGASYLSGAVAYGWQDVTTNRTVTLAGIDQLRARFNANAWSGRVEGGYRFVAPVFGGFGLTPYAAGQFAAFDLPAYAEGVVSGANTFALAYSAKSVTDTRSELGIRSDKSYPLQTGILTLRGRAAWAHDFNPERAIAATFQALPGASFVANGAAQARDAALTTASAEMKWLNGWSAAATFEGEFSSVTRSYAGKGVARYAW